MISPVPTIFPGQHPPPSVIQTPGPPQQQPSNQLQPVGSQSSILGQPPPIYGGPVLPGGVPPQGFPPNMPNHPPGPGIYAGSQMDSNQPPPPSMQQLPHPPPYGINMIPFQSPPPSMMNSAQAGQNFMGGQVLVSSSLTDVYQLPAMADSQYNQQGSYPPTAVSEGSSEFQKFSVSMVYANKLGEGSEMSPLPVASIGLSMSGHQPVLFSAATHSTSLPVSSTGGAVGGVRSSENLFNLGIESLSSLYPNTAAPQPTSDATGGSDESKASSDAFQLLPQESKAKGDSSIYSSLPYLQQQPVGFFNTGQSAENSDVPTPGGFVIMTSSGLISAPPPNTSVSSTAPRSEDSGLDSLLPIGTERAQRSSNAPSFAALPPGTKYTVI